MKCELKLYVHFSLNCILPEENLPGVDLHIDVVVLVICSSASLDDGHSLMVSCSNQVHC